MIYETLRCDIDQRGVATLQLHRPDKRNALSEKMIDELTNATGALGGNADVRAVVLSSEGKAFCAGGDLDWMIAQFNSDRQTRMAGARKLAMMLFALNTMPKPLIARVHADAFGGGVGLLSVCDEVVASDGARFGLTETRLGLIPATISPYVIARMGEGPARRVFMSSRIFPAAQAKELGLVSSVVKTEALDETVAAAVTPYLSVAPGAVGAAKALARSLGPPITEDIIEATIVRFADMGETEEAKEGVTAFLEKRKPSWIACGDDM